MLTYNPRYDEFLLNGKTLFINECLANEGKTPDVSKQILRMLWARNTVTIEEFIDGCYDEDPDGGPLYAESVIRNRITVLNKTLEKNGYSIVWQGRKMYSINKVSAEQRKAA